MLPGRLGGGQDSLLVSACQAMSLTSRGSMQCGPRVVSVGWTDLGSEGLVAESAAGRTCES